MIFEEIEGGLRTKLKLDYYYPPIEEFEEEIHFAEKCERDVNYEKFQWEIKDVRRHNRLMEDCHLKYFPYMYPAIDIKTKFGKFLWHVFCTSIRPEKAYIARAHVAKDSYAVHGFERVLFKSELAFPELKRKFLVTFARIIRRQNDLIYVTVENADLSLDDGLRVLLALSIGAGRTLDQVNVWRLFRKGIMPLTSQQTDDLMDQFSFTPEDQRMASDTEKEKIWSDVVMAENLIVIDPTDSLYLLRVCLNSFENLLVLSIHFCWITYGQGTGLCQLGCVRNGRLKELRLLCTEEDLPEKTGQAISYLAWQQALSTCPQLKVHLVIFCIPDYDRNKQFLCQNMPLESYHLSTGFTCVDLNKVRPAWFDCILRTLIFRYQTTLRKLSLHLWHPRQRVDSILCLCLKKFHYLEMFDYSGPLDKLDSLHEICEFVSTQPLRIKTLWLNIQEDPCRSNVYRSAIREVYDKYKHEFQNKGINFTLDTYRI